MTFIPLKIIKYETLTKINTSQFWFHFIKKSTQICAPIEAKFQFGLVTETEKLNPENQNHAPSPSVYPISSLLNQKILNQSGKVIWLCGLSGSGKSTLASLLKEDLASHRLDAYVLDGDNLRKGLCSNLGFSDADRLENIRRAAEVANLLKTLGLIVICSFITPLEQHRQLAQSIIGAADFIPVHIKCSLQGCIERDPKGLYQKARAGKIAAFTGVSSTFEAPHSQFFEINTEMQSIAESRVSLFSAMTRLIPALAPPENCNS